MSNNYFKFKQFSINHEHSAMKVGTDGVLLGAWINVNQEKYILDIGTGTGLIALMIAQKCNAKIIGIEIDKIASEEAKTNVEQTPFKQRVEIINQDFKLFYPNTKYKFDLIVSNPPYFENSLKSPSMQRNQARHNNFLTIEELLDGCLKIMTKNGRLALIYPYDGWETLKYKAEAKGLRLKQQVVVRSFENKAPVRILAEFSKLKISSPIQKQLILYKNEKRERTNEYWELTKAFYLDK